jgi:hypothetical protein
LILSIVLRCRLAKAGAQGAFSSLIGIVRKFLQEVPSGDNSMKRIAATTLSLLTLASVSAFAAGSTMNGWISDAMCGAKHAGTGAACAKKCLEGGEKPVFVDEAKKQVWTIDNPDAVKEAYGKHVALKVTADAAAKSVHVDSVSVLAD